MRSFTIRSGAPGGRPAACQVRLDAFSPRHDGRHEDLALAAFKAAVTSLADAREGGLPPAAAAQAGAVLARASDWWRSGRPDMAYLGSMALMAKIGSGWREIELDVEYDGDAQQDLVPEWRAEFHRLFPSALGQRIREMLGSGAADASLGPEPEPETALPVHLLLRH